MCTHSVRCQKHSDTQRRTVRTALFGDDCEAGHASGRATGGGRPEGQPEQAVGEGVAGVVAGRLDVDGGVGRLDAEGQGQARQAEACEGACVSAEQRVRPAEPEVVGEVGAA